MSTTFAELGVPADLVRTLAARGITAPFPVQAATLPDLLAGRDVAGRAPTGSGKTLAFGIPLAATVERAKPCRPRALVLAPTRELAAQIDAELRPLAAVRDRRVTAVFGGVGFEPQRKALRRGVDIVVACPGRLLDLCSQGDVDLGEVTTVVLDEADRMADMGFLPQVRKLLAKTSADRQTVLFSATLDGDVAALVRDQQHDAVRHEIGPAEPDVTALRHEFLVVAPTDRATSTASLVAEHGSTVVFCRTRHIVDRVVKLLTRADVDAAAIHGGRSQGQRTRALEAFRSGKVQALVATDVAARGIHVDDVACVVHYDLAADAKDYVHRSGRTGRAGATGVVVWLVAPAQVRDARRLGRDVGIEVALPSDPARPRERRQDAPPAHRQPRSNGSQPKGSKGAPSGRSRTGERSSRSNGSQPKGASSGRARNGERSARRRRRAA